MVILNFPRLVLKCDIFEKADRIAQNYQATSDRAIYILLCIEGVHQDNGMSHKSKVIFNILIYITYTFIPVFYTMYTLVLLQSIIWLVNCICRLGYCFTIIYITVFVKPVNHWKNYIIHMEKMIVDTYNYHLITNKLIVFSLLTANQSESNIAQCVVIMK